MRKRNKANQNPERKWVGLGGLALLALALLAFYIFRGSASSPESPDPASSAQDTSASRRLASDSLYAKTRHVKGDPSAPVTIIEFSDFQ
jgi:hypothetical protein